MNTIRILWLAPFALLATAAPASAQAACDGRVVGTLGITGLECRDCSFSSNPAGLSAARFGTEPRILEVDRDASGGDDLASGDVIVAVNGHLITTSAGVEALTSLRPGQDVRLTVRRRNGVHAVDMVAGEACIPRPPAPPMAPDPSQAAPPGRPPVPRPGAAPAGETTVPPAPAPPRAVVPPYPPGPLDASLGFSFRCSDCGIVVSTPGTDESRWFFSEPPVVNAVDRDGPASAAGIRSGDVLVAVDDIPLTDPEGGVRFHRIRAGETVAFTVRRDGEERVVRIEAGERPSRDELILTIPRTRVAPTAVPALPSPTLRYTGTIGDTSIEVRGAPVTVSEDPATGEIIIRSADLEVRVKRDKR